MAFMSFIKCFCSMSTENMFALLFSSKFCIFSWVSSLWPASIPNIHAFGPRLNVIEDPCYRVTRQIENDFECRQIYLIHNMKSCILEDRLFKRECQGENQITSSLIKIVTPISVTSSNSCQANVQLRRKQYYTCTTIIVNPHIINQHLVLSNVSFTLYYSLKSIRHRADQIFQSCQRQPNDVHALRSRRFNFRKPCPRLYLDCLISF